MAKYQLAADAYEGKPYSGVIRDDGKWIPCEAGNGDWYEYLDWVHADEKNRPDPFKSVEDGGIEIKLVEHQKAVGSMVRSVKNETDMPPAPPRDLPHRTDIYTPPPMPTDASMPPANEQRSDAVRGPEDRAARETAPVAGIWTQDEVNVGRRDASAESRSDPRPTVPTTEQRDTKPAPKPPEEPKRK